MSLNQTRIAAWPIMFALFASIAAAFAVPDARAVDKAGNDIDRFAVEFDAEKDIATLHIDAPAGELAWADLLRGIARMKGFDDQALVGLLPNETIELDSFKTRLLVVGLDQALGDGIALAMVEKGGAPVGMRVTMDRIALLETKRKLKRRLGDIALSVRALLRDDTSPERGLTLHDNWPSADPDKPGVIFVHGLNGGDENRDPWLDSLRDVGFPTGAFTYRNDGPVRTAGANLAEAIDQLAADHPGRNIALVTFSMGGLVAREAIENPDHLPDDRRTPVRTLIMVGPPNHGSEMARFAFALEISEYIANLEDHEPLEALMHTIEDGLGEASDDLMPDSPFLRELNQRKRNPNVKYSIILGTGGPLTEAQLALMRTKVREEGEENRFMRFLGPKVLDWLEDLDEVVQGKGDGAVAIKRGRLEGVDDTITLPFDHATALEGAATTEIQRRLRAAVRQRLSDHVPVDPAGDDQ